MPGCLRGLQPLHTFTRRAAYCADRLPPPSPCAPLPLRLALLQVCDIALHYLDVCLPAQGPLTATPVAAPGSSAAAASALACPPASSSPASGDCAMIEPLAALADPEAQAAFMRERLFLVAQAAKVAAAALSRWVPRRALW